MQSLFIVDEVEFWRFQKDPSLLYPPAVL
jgi:hypothetical protein